MPGLRVRVSANQPAPHVRQDFSRAADHLFGTGAINFRSHQNSSSARASFAPARGPPRRSASPLRALSPSAVFELDSPAALGAAPPDSSGCGDGSGGGRGSPDRRAAPTPAELLANLDRYLQQRPAGDGGGPPPRGSPARRSPSRRTATEVGAEIGSRGGAGHARRRAGSPRRLRERQLQSIYGA